MTINLVSSIEVDASPETVWEQLINFENWPAWSRLHDRVWEMSTPDAQIGTTFRYKLSLTGMCLAAKSVLEQVEPQRFLQMRTKRLSVHETHALALQPSPGGGTIITDEMGFSSRLFPPPFSVSRLVFGWLRQRWINDIKSEAERRERGLMGVRTAH